MDPGPSEQSQRPAGVRRGERRRTEQRSRTASPRRGPDPSRSHKENEGGDEGERGERKQGGKDRIQGDTERRLRGRRAESEGAEGREELRRWRLNQLEKEKLELMSSSNQEVCRLQAELARLRAAVERGEAQRAELQYQLTASRRDAERVSELSRERHTLSERAADLQQTVSELQEALLVTQQARQEDQHALQQEVEERDRLIRSFGSENQRLQRLLQDQEEALEESQRRISAVLKEQHKEEEENRRQAEELKVSDQRLKSLESKVETERAVHLEAKYKVEVLQLRVRDLEEAAAAARSDQREAQGVLELLRLQFREVERAYGVERERSSSTERALQRLQAETTVALETERKATSDLSDKLEEEKKQHANTHSLLQQAAGRQSDSEEAFRNLLQQIRDALQQHTNTPPAKDDGKWSPAEVLQLLTETLSSWKHGLEDLKKQVQDQLLVSQELQEENVLLQQLTSDQRRRAEESQQVLLRLEEEVAHLHQDSSDWSARNQRLEEELHKEKEERRGEIQKITEDFNKESTVRLSFLYCLYQRLLAGCILLQQPQSILGDFTWQELCDVISEQVDQLTSDLQRANEEIVHLRSVCDRKSVCVRELQRKQECVLSRLEESVRRREEAWSRQHTHTVKQLQLCRCQGASHRDLCSSLELRLSSLELRLSSLTSDLSNSRLEVSSLVSACSLLAGALEHAHHRLKALCEQKNLLSRRLEDREQLEEEVRRLADALGGEEEEGGGRRAVRRWRRSVCAVLAMKRWCVLTRKTTALFQLDGGRGGVCVCVCGDSSTATQEGQDVPQTDAEGVCARWLQSERLSSIVLSSVADLQGALSHTGSSPPSLISAARSGLSRLLDHLLDQSAFRISSGGVEENTLSHRLKLGLSRLSPRQLDLKALVSALQQHFLLFSQRLHSAEVERRGLRLEVANLKRGLKHERDEKLRAVLAEQFHSVCSELRQALAREQEAQTLIQNQSKQLHTLQLRVNKQWSEDTHTQHTLSPTTQVLSEAQKEVSRKERSLRILGKHLSGVQKERRQLEERLQRAEEELRDASRRREAVIQNLKTVETSCRQVKDALVQSQHSLSSQLRPLSLPWDRQELSRAESIMGAPEAAAFQSFLSVVSQLCHACSSRIDWLQQEVSAHRSHVTALRGELQDACLRDNLAFIPVETLLPADVETPEPVRTSPAPS